MASTRKRAKAVNQLDWTDTSEKHPWNVVLEHRKGPVVFGPDNDGRWFFVPTSEATGYERVTCGSLQSAFNTAEAFLSMKKMVN